LAQATLAQAVYLAIEIAIVNIHHGPMLAEMLQRGRVGRQRSL